MLTTEIWCNEARSPSSAFPAQRQHLGTKDAWVKSRQETRRIVEQRKVQLLIINTLLDRW